MTAKAGTGLEVAPGLSVVVPVRNMALSLRLQLDAVLAQQTSFSFELIVVDNMSTDNVPEIIAEYSSRDSRVTGLIASPAGINVARNVGIRHARAEVIALCDADDVVEPGWAEALFQSHEPDAYLGGALRRGGPNSVKARQRWGIDSQPPAVPSYEMWGFATPAGANCAFSKSLWVCLDGFNECLGLGGDETEFFARAGRLGYRYKEVPGAVVSYRLPDSARGVWRRGYKYGRNSGRATGADFTRKRLGLVLKQCVWLALRIPVVVTRARARYTWLHTLAKRCGELTYLLHDVGRDHEVLQSSRSIRPPGGAA